MAKLLKKCNDSVIIFRIFRYFCGIQPNHIPPKMKFEKIEGLIDAPFTPFDAEGNVNS